MENQQLLEKKAKGLTILSVILFWPFRLISYGFTVSAFMGVSISDLISIQGQDMFMAQLIVWCVAKIAIITSFIILLVARNKCKQYAVSRVMMKIHLIMEYIAFLLVSSVVFESCSRW